ncbi:serine/threonine-protein kinase [Streptomyces sp. MB09-01]|uniref:serine/threonine-protein kinase n=1 Tax=Streptomyces sp. MB09-01 TaxID=3028666 RepID=UPI0029B31B5D|nr:serine/threonine-protein kinase [Streptomyces sp. MB09-01]MDX3540594.1 serine/threonine-protein kinase [Streptomyces sp. MB09-01]
MEALRDTDPAHIGAQALLARLGAGGMGQVYLGRSPGGRLVAIKVIKEEITGHPEALARFRREAETVRAVRSAYTANLIDASLAAPPYWIATEYVAGPTLSHAVRAYGALPAAACRRLFAALAEGLASVHAYGVTHRDLKPQNVILGVQGPQLIDFGIAKGVAETALTQAGSAPGTPGYTAPEVLLRGEAADAADVFALGATIAYAATGRAPYGTGEPTAVNFRAVHGEIDVEGVEPDLAALVRACVATEPGARPALAEIIRRCAVDSALVDDPVYAALTATAGGAAQVPGLPSTIGPGLPAGSGYVPTYVPAGQHQNQGQSKGPDQGQGQGQSQNHGRGPDQGQGAGRRRPPRWALAAVGGLVAGGLVTGGYLFLQDEDGKGAGGGSRAGGPPSGRSTPGGPAAPSGSGGPASSPAPSSQGGGSGSGAVPDHIEPNKVSRDLWTSAGPGGGGCSLPAEERAEFLVGSVVDADTPEAKTVTGKVKIRVYLKSYNTEQGPYVVSVGVKAPHEIDESTQRPYEFVRDYNHGIGYTSKPVDLKDPATGGEVELTYPDDFATQLVDNGGTTKRFPGIPVANDPGDWTVLVYRVRGVKEYSSVYCTGFPVK